MCLSPYCLQQNMYVDIYIPVIPRCVNIVCAGLITCSQNRQSTKFQNHENTNFAEKLYFFILYNQVYIAKHGVKSLHSGFIFRENTSHYKVGG